MRPQSFIAILSALVVTLSGCERDAVPAKAEQVATEAADSIPAGFEEVAIDGLDLSVPSDNETAGIRKKAEHGDAAAQTRLGRMYRYGKGAAKDASKAMEWFRKSAEQRDAIAQLNLAWMYRHGIGVTKDASKAVEWFRKAAEQRNAIAQFQLGLLYSEGEGVPRDATEATAWYRKAADQDYAEAQFHLGRMYTRGQGLPKDEAKAAEWYRKAAEQGHINALFHLGLSYHGGLGLPKDLAKAAEAYRKAAEQGDSKAQTLLGYLYDRGEGLPKDVAKAVEWYKKAADKGEAFAQNNLGVKYEHGVGVPRDSVKAVEWYHKAAEQGDTFAQRNLGVMYANGNGVGRDIVLAYAWLNLAAAGGHENARELRDSLGLSNEQRAEAERLSSNWEKGQRIVRDGTAYKSSGTVSGKPTKTGAGTAFLVSKAGHAVTNHHVVANCAKVRVEGRDGEVKVVTSDVANDIALLHVPGEIGAAATLSDAPGKLRQGEDVVVFGFPLNAVLSSGGNLTPGVVSALTGLGNNTNEIQITAAIQPGSSGSPVLNKKGEVVGVVSMKLSDREMARATGTLGQNVNFAVSGLTLTAFLQAHKVNYRTGSLFSFGKDSADLADEARKWTLVVECWK